jgi:hypothetical protein
MVAPGNLSIMNTWVSKMIRKLLLRYEYLILLGLTITILALSNVLGYSSIDSDLFWAVAGIGLVVEAILELYFDVQEESVEKVGETSIFKDAEKRYGPYVSKEESE